MKKNIILFGAIIFLSAALVQSPKAGLYFQDFSSAAIGATNFTDGSQLFSTDYSTAQVVYSPYNELQLTANGIGSTESAYMLPDLDSGSAIYAFSAKWNAPVYGNFGGNPTSADGYSFNFGQLSTSNLISGSLESGYGTGLSFDVQTYSGNNPGFYIRVNGSVVAGVAYNPATEWGVNNGTRHFFEVDWSYYTGMTVRMDGQTIFANVATPGFLPAGGERFVWGARCGADSEFIRLDNIAVVTGGNLVPLPPASPYLSNGNDYSANPLSLAFDGDNSTYWYNYGSLPCYAAATYLPTNVVAAYTLTSANNGTAAYDPEAWTLESINSGSIWNLCSIGSGYFLNREETRCWLATNYVGYSTYRLRVSANESSGSGAALGELRLYALSKVDAPLTGWVSCSTPSASWHSLACSTNGQVVVAAGSGKIYASVNSGVTWTQTAAQGAFVACSANGVALSSLGDYTSTTYNSTNSGTNWVSAPFATAYEWNAIAPFAGDHVFGSFYAISIGIDPSPEYDFDAVLASTYVNGGTGALGYQVLQQVPAPAYLGSGWDAICCPPANTSRVALGGWNGSTPSYSSNSGSTLNRSTVSGSASLTDWSSMASSWTGNLMLAGAWNANNDNVYLYSSTDYGASWYQMANCPPYYITSLASSADGTKWVAGTDYGIYISTNSASTWTLANAPLQQWDSVASTSDGNRLFAGSDSGVIYTWSPTNTVFITPRAPALAHTFVGSYSRLSWPVSSGGNFVLQQSTNLASANWSNISWPVVSANGQYQVTFPHTENRAFFRLKTP